jgi:hypothetical protein
VREWESRSVSQVRPGGRTVLKSRLRWSATWLREGVFYRRGPVVWWALAGGIDRFLIAMLDHVDSFGFVVRISLRANPEDRVVVDGVPIGVRVRPSIGSVVFDCLTAAWNVVAEFLRLRGNSKLIVVMRRASCSWARCSRSSSCTTLLVLELGTQDRRHAPLFLLLSRVLKIIIVRRYEWWRSEKELHAYQKLLVVDTRCHEFIRMNLSASLLLGAPLSMSYRRIFGVGLDGTQVDEINLT